MSRSEIIEYFSNHKDEFENLYQSHLPVFKSYLEARRDHKKASFGGNHNQDLDDQARFEYGLLLERRYLASAENIEDLVLTTAIQDLIIFDEIMLEKVVIFEEKEICTKEEFIKRQRENYQALFNMIIGDLPEDAREYVTQHHRGYKTDLYLHNKIVSELYTTNTNRLNALLRAYDEIKEKIMNAIAYQDLFIICMKHEAI